MISLPNNLPLVRFSDGQVIQFERGWLAGTLARAAERAGYKKWWLAPHVTESVTNYLEQDFPESIVAIGRLEKAVQSVLQVIGYADVAGHFCAVPPPTRISLVDLARAAGCGYFFRIAFSGFRPLRAGGHPVPVDIHPARLGHPPGQARSHTSWPRRMKPMKYVTEIACHST